jgi:hypothetical protein
MAGTAEMALPVAVIIDGMHRSSCLDALQFNPVFELSIA